MKGGQLCERNSQGIFLIKGFDSRPDFPIAVHVRFDFIGNVYVYDNYVVFTNR